MSDQWSDKYRPKTLEHFVGQPAAVAYIKGLMKEKRVPNCVLISGPSGCGKTTLARLAAASFSRWEGDPNKNPDAMELEANVNRGIDDVREAIRNSKYSPKGGFRRCMIVDEVHGLVGPAASALLKATEEPALKTTWFLCTDQPWLLKIPTAMRAASIALDTVPDEAIVKLLTWILKCEKTNLGNLQDKILLRIAQMSYGVPRQAVQFLDSVYTTVKGGGKPSDALKMVMRGNPIADQFQAALKFVTAVLNGKESDAVRVIAHGGTCDGMVELTNKMISAAACNAATGRPTDGFGWAIQKNLPQLSSKDLPKLLALQTRAVVALDIRTRYQVPSNSIMLSLARVS